MTVAALWRYPVKSMGGEQHDAVTVDERGVVGDRAWALRTPEDKLASGKTTRRFQRVGGLLEWSATIDGEVPLLRAPTGELLRGDDAGVHDALSAQIGTPLRLSRETDIEHHDAAPLHLLTTASLRWLTARSEIAGS